MFKVEEIKEFATEEYNVYLDSYYNRPEHNLDYALIAGKWYRHNELEVIVGGDRFGLLAIKQKHLDRFELESGTDNFYSIPQD